MNFLWYIIFAILGLIILLALIYFILLYKLKNLNIKLSRYRVEKDLKENNVMIVYQPSRRGTIEKIVEQIKSCLNEKNYGYVVSTLSEKEEDFNNYKYTIFVAPVYFGEIHKRFIEIINRKKIKNLIFVYNGLNVDSNNEDKIVKDHSLSTYKKIKLHTNDIEMIKEFIFKEVK